MPTTNPTTSPGFSVADIADFAAWALTKDAGERYVYCDAGECAVAQFGRETGREYLIGLDRLGDYSVPLRDAVIGSTVPLSAGWTFGALASRLQALLPDTVSVWVSPDAYLVDIERVTA